MLIFPGGLQVARLFLLCERTADFGGRAHDQTARRNHRVLGHQGPGSHERVLADHTAVEEGSAHTDDTAIAHRTAVQDRPVAHGHVLTDLNGESLVSMHHAAILKVGAGPDMDGGGIGAEHRTILDTGARLQGDLSHQGGIFRDPGIGMELGCMSFKGFDHM